MAKTLVTKKTLETHQINHGQPDPITNCELSDDCWNGKHWAKRLEHDDDGPHVVEVGCVGWMDKGKTEPCQCYCHRRQPRKRVKKDPKATLSIMDSGCGTIEIK